MAKPNRTNRDRLSDDSADTQPEGSGTGAADLPVDDDLVTDVDGLDADSLPADGVDEDVTSEAKATVDEDATAASGADKASKVKAADTKAAKDEKPAAAKPAGRNRKAAGGGSTAGGTGASAKTSSSKPSAKSGAKSSAKSGNPAKRASNRKTASYTSTPGTQTIKPNGRWFVPTMVTILLLGLAWLVVFYISNGAYPVGAWGYWNLGVGFAILVAGLVMSTRWR